MDLSEDTEHTFIPGVNVLRLNDIKTQCKVYRGDLSCCWQRLEFTYYKVWKLHYSQCSPVMSRQCGVSDTLSSNKDVTNYTSFSQKLTFFIWWPKIFQQKKRQQDKKKNLFKKDPCVDYWLTLTVLLPTWGSQWFVSGMAELLSGRRAYVTGAADNTWVLSRGPGEWPGSLRETERSPQPTASAHGGLRGSIYCWDWEHKFVLLALRSFM